MARFHERALARRRDQRDGRARRADDLARRALITQLSHNLLDLTGEGDFWSVGDAVEGGTVILGGPGSGKTSASAAKILEALLRAGAGGIYLTVKADDAAHLLALAERTGRSRDVVLFGPRHSARFNFLNYIAARCQEQGASVTENIVHLLREVMARFDAVAADAARADPFWERSRDDLLRNVLDLLRLAGWELSLGAITDLVHTSPRTLAEMRHVLALTRAVLDGRGDAEPETPFERAWVNAARNHARGDVVLDAHTFHQTMSFWREAWPRMPDKTQGSIEATLHAMASPLQRDMAELFCTATTITPEDTLHGILLVLDMPVKLHFEAGAIAQTIVKTLWQRAVERRSLGPRATARPVFLWADEAHEFLTRDSDLRFAATARGARAAAVFITQSVAGLRARLGADGAAQFLDTLQTKIVHACDGETAQWAADLIGEEWRFRGSFTSEGDASFTESREHRISKEVFSELARGGPGESEAVVFKPGRLWSNGSNWLRVGF
ncbi:MAG: type IV secretory system conjugative DNA transfer family protein [Myxococcota bacterium]